MSGRLKPYKIQVVDVSTERPLAGNQLAVVLDAEGIPGEAMQRISREMNFSDTTFVLAPKNPGHAPKLESSLRDARALFTSSWLIHLTVTCRRASRSEAQSSRC